MKTFEERYTAWIDGQLNGSALSAFEEELKRRAAEGDAEADKAEAGQLRSLLKEHLQAPVLTNTEFFSHQMRQRIDAECSQAAHRREVATGTGAFRFPTFAWPFGRLVGVGAASLFVAAALYYGLMPSHPGTGGSDGGNLASNASPAPVPQVAPSPDDTQVASNGSPAPQTSAPNNLLALRSPMPSPVIDLDGDLSAHVAPNSGSTTATPLHYKDPNVNVLWVDGLDYLPSVSGTPAAATPAPTPAAAASVSP